MLDFTTINEKRDQEKHIVMKIGRHFEMKKAFKKLHHKTGTEICNTFWYGMPSFHNIFSVDFMEGHTMTQFT